VLPSGCSESCKPSKFQGLERLCVPVSAHAQLPNCWTCMLRTQSSTWRGAGHLSSPQPCPSPRPEAGTLGPGSARRRGRRRGKRDARHPPRRHLSPAPGHRRRARFPHGTARVPRVRAALGRRRGRALPQRCAPRRGGALPGFWQVEEGPPRRSHAALGRRREGVPRRYRAPGEDVS
jgi:hypothetical protein